MSSNGNPTSATPTTSAATSSPPPAKRPQRPKGARRRPLARSYEPPAAPVLLDSKEAADALRCSPEALRARCRRAAVVGSDGSVTATLAPGVVAIKFGKSTWRVRFDNAK